MHSVDAILILACTAMAGTVTAIAVATIICAVVLIAGRALGA